MRILIVYYSKTGNTEKVAQTLAREIGADLEKIIDQKKRNGFIGYFTGGRDAIKKRLTEIAPLSKKTLEYDLIVMGMPVWGWNLVPAIRTYLAQNNKQIKKYAFFVTSGDTDAQKLAGHFAEAAGQEAVALVGFNKKELAGDMIDQNKLKKFIEQIKNINL